MDILAVDFTYSTFLELATVVLSFWYLYYRIKRWDMVRYAGEIPGEKGHPIIGSALIFRSMNSIQDAVDKFYDAAEKFSEFGIMKYWFGPSLVVCVWEPSYIEIVASSPHTASKGPLYNLFFGEMSSGVFTVAGGPKWKMLRKPLTKSFVKKYIDKEYFPIFVQKSNDFRDCIMRNKLGKYENVKQDLAALTLDIFFDSHLGLDANEITERKWNYTKLIDDYFQISITACMKYSVVTWKNVARFTSLGPQIEDIRRRRLAIMDWIFGEHKVPRRKREDDGEYYTDFLLRRAGNTKSSIDKLHKELTDVIVAGTDTSAVALSSAVLFLAMFPEVQQEAYREQVEIFGDSDRDPTIHDLANMKYLDRVYKETLRLVTPAATLKLSDDHVSLGKYTIPKDSHIVVFVYRVHRDPRYWERPNTFYPDHFLPEKEMERPRYAYIPFGVGPRMCPGFQYGVNSALVILSTILRSFRLSTKLKFEDIVFEMRLMVIVRDGYLVQFDKR